MTNSSPQTLREVAQLASDRNGGARGRELGRIAEKRGLTLSYTTVDRILTGKYLSRPGPKTLEALAALSGLPRDSVYQAAGVPVPLAPLADQLPEGADSLSPEQRMVVLSAIRQFAELNRALQEARHEEVVGSGQQPAPMKQAGPGPAHEDAPDDWPVSEGGYMLAARDADDDAESEAQQIDP